MTSRWAYGEDELRAWFNWMRSIENTQFYFRRSSVYAEEDKEEESVGQDVVSDSELIDIIDMSSLTDLPKGLIFIDGVVRHRVIGTFGNEAVRIPVVFAHMIAGAMKLESKEPRPLIKKELKVALFPFKASREFTGISFLPPYISTLEEELDRGSVRFETLLAESDISTIFSDTSVTLGESFNQQRRDLITGNDLIASGKVYVVALNRIKEILRALELALTIYISKTTKDDDLIIVDGPIAPLLKYVGLVNPSLRKILRLKDTQSALEAYNLLNKVVGAVKKVVKVPSTLTKDISEKGVLNPAFIYMWRRLIEDQDVSKDDNYISTYVLSAIFRLRPELVFRENYPAFSPLSGLVRVDVPLPAIMERDEWLSWITQNYEWVGDQGLDRVRQLIVNNVKSRTRLKEILNIIYTLRYPLPSASGYRNLVELYPIKDVEDWLKAYLLTKYEFSAIGLF